MKGPGQHTSGLIEPNDDLPAEYTLSHKYFQRIVSHFAIPVVDLFVSELNRYVLRFFTQYYHFQAEAMDALMSPWPSGLLYAFTPIPLLPKVLRKFRGQKSTLIMVTPWWPRRPWLSMFHQLSQILPLQLQVSWDTLHQGLIWHPHLGRLHLTAWLLKRDGY